MYFLGKNYAVFRTNYEEICGIAQITGVNLRFTMKTVKNEVL